MRIAYVDSSVVVRYYLEADHGHAEAVALIEDAETAVITSMLTMIEASGALVRAARNAGIDPVSVLARLDADLTDGPVTLVGADVGQVEHRALDIVRASGIRALDALHIAVAGLVLPELTTGADRGVFYTRDERQAQAAEAHGLQLV